MEVPLKILFNSLTKNGLFQFGCRFWRNWESPVVATSGKEKSVYDVEIDMTNRIQ
jgi:hypothetical protein